MGWIQLPIQKEKSKIPSKNTVGVSLLWAGTPLEEWITNPSKLSLSLIKMQWNCNVAHHHRCSSHFFLFCTEDRIKCKWERGGKKRKPNLWLFKVLTSSTATCRIFAPEDDLYYYLLYYIYYILFIYIISSDQQLHTVCSRLDLSWKTWISNTWALCGTRRDHHRRRHNEVWAS